MRLTQNYFCIIIILIIRLQHAKTANILVTVVGITGSQNLVMYRLAEIMGERGHNVSILKLEFFPESRRIQLKYAKEISYEAVPDPDITPCVIAGKDRWSQSGSQPMPVGKALKVFRQIRLSCESLLDNKKMLKQLNDSHFDVMVIYLLDFCSFGLTRLLNLDSYVWMSTAMLIDPMAWYSGSPLAHGYVPNIFIAPSNPNGQLTFLERIKNLMASLATLAAFRYGVTNTYTDLFRNRYGKDFPHFDDIFKKTQSYFVNVDPNFEYARPVSPNVINVGGLTMKEVYPLTEEWQKIMDTAPDEGVVIFSLGTVADIRKMPHHIRIAFLNAIKRLPHLFLWKFEGQFPEANSVKNVLLSSWLPQKDLMAHHKVKAAIIHGGYNSLTETTYLGVPVVVIPLWGDQYGNAIRVTRQNIGVQLALQNLTEQVVFQALRNVLYDNSIRQNAKRMGQMIREKPFSSHQQAIEWIEYLAKFKRLDQLQPQSHDLCLVEYLSLDVIIFLMVTVAVLIGFIVFSMKVCCKLCRRGSSKAIRKGKKKCD